VTQAYSDDGYRRKPRLKPARFFTAAACKPRANYLMPKEIRELRKAAAMAF
jgi:hypothetical protein